MSEHRHTFSYVVRSDRATRLVLQPSKLGALDTANLLVLLVVGVGIVALRLQPLLSPGPLPPVVLWALGAGVAYVLGFRIYLAFSRPDRPRLVCDHRERAVRREKPQLFLPYDAVRSVLLQARALPNYGGWLHRLSLRDKDGRSHLLDTSSDSRTVGTAVLLARRLGVGIEAPAGLLPAADAALRLDSRNIDSAGPGAYAGGSQ